MRNIFFSFEYIFVNRVTGAVGALSLFWKLVFLYFFRPIVYFLHARLMEMSKF